MYTYMVKLYFYGTNVILHLLPQLKHTIINAQCQQNILGDLVLH